MNYLPSIDLDIAERLRADAEFRQAYFLAESSGMIARQLIGLRKRRGLRVCPGSCSFLTELSQHEAD
jgi:hypothetical protein